MNVVDSSGWLEFFRAGANGPVFKPGIEDRNHLLVPTMSLFDVHRVLSRSVDADLVKSCLDVIRLGRVLDFTDARAGAAAHIAALHKLARAKAAIYAMAREFDSTFWTQDADYQWLDGVRYQPKPGA